MSYSPSAEMGARDALLDRIHRLERALGEAARTEDRLRADLADAQRKIAAALAIVYEITPDLDQPLEYVSRLHAALSAGGGGPAEGAGSE